MHKYYKIIWGKPSHTSLGCLGVHVLSNVALVFLVGMICILPCFHPWHQKLVWMRTFCEIWIKNELLFCFFECLPCSIRKRVSFAWFLQVMRGRWLLLGLFQPLQQLHWTTVEAKNGVTVSKNPLGYMRGTPSTFMIHRETVFMQDPKYMVTDMIMIILLAVFISVCIYSFLFAGNMRIMLAYATEASFSGHPRDGCLPISAYLRI